MIPQYLETGCSLKVAVTGSSVSLSVFTLAKEGNEVGYHEPNTRRSDAHLETKLSNDDSTIPGDRLLLGGGGDTGHLTPGAGHPGLLLPGGKIVSNNVRPYGWE